MSSTPSSSLLSGIANCHVPDGERPVGAVQPAPRVVMMPRASAWATLSDSVPAGSSSRCVIFARFSGLSFAGAK